MFRAAPKMIASCQRYALRVPIARHFVHGQCVEVRAESEILRHAGFRGEARWRALHAGNDVAFAAAAATYSAGQTKRVSRATACV